MAKKKKAKAVNSRVAEHRARMRENGYRQVAVLLPTATIAKLDKLAKLSNEPRATVIDLLIQDGASRLAAKQDPQPTKKKAPAKKPAAKKAPAKKAPAKKPVAKKAPAKKAAPKKTATKKA